MKKFAEIWDDIKEKKYKNEYIKEIDENMPSRKRTVKYEENTDPVDGDKNVEVSEEQSVSDDQYGENGPEEQRQKGSYTAKEDDERFNAASG